MADRKKGDLWIKKQGKKVDDEEELPKISRYIRQKPRKVAKIGGKNAKRRV